MLRTPGIRALFCLCMFTNTAVIAKSETPVTVTVLDKGEFYDSMIWHSGYLFVGKSRLNFNSNYSLEIYDNNLKLVETLRLDHAAAYIAAYGPKSVILNGINPEIRMTQYSIVKMDDGKFELSTNTLPDPVWADRWLGNIGGAEYFADSGGNLEDPATQEDIMLTAQTIFRTTAEGPRYLSTRISRPTVGVPYGEGLFVVQAKGVGSGRSDILWVNPEDPNYSVVLADYPATIRDLRLSTVTNKLLAIEEERPRLIAINPETKSKLWEISLGQRPFSIQPVGHCALVGDFDTREIFVVNIAGETPNLINKISIDLDPSKFKALNKVTVDEANSRIFARSNIACNPLIETCEDYSNRVVALEASAILKKCL